MEVAHAEDKVTHVVLGNQETMDMGISSSAEFFQILSSTLYTNQKLAVVRETLCNAWDAHIDSGKTDVPIEIELNDGNQFIIRDFGKGIHHDLIQPIYGVYGSSTKKKDGRVTGGFGLGCKAPFAYTEHFEVTSMHEGMLSIYSMSKSSGEVMGKPGITTIVNNIPTEESGIKVVIQLNPSDVHTFRELIIRVVQRGEIKAKLNGSLIEDLIELSKSKLGYAIINNMRNKESDIYVRYGNVIYPVFEHEFYREPYKEVKKQLEKLCYSSSRYYSSGSTASNTVVLMAEPNTIAVTPSRESLSNQDHTIKSVRLLLLKFIDNLKQKHTHYVPELVKERIKANSDAKNHNIFFAVDGVRWVRSDSSETLVAYSSKEVANIYMINRMISYTNQSRKLAIQHLVDNKIIERGLAYSWLRQVTYEGGYGKRASNWAMRKIIAPLCLQLDKGTLLTSKNLGIYSTSCIRQWSKESQYKDSQYDAKTVQYNYTKDCLNLLRKYVVISRTYKGTHELNNYSRIPEFIQGLNESFFYITGPDDKHYQEALEFFKNAGYVIHDLVELQNEKLAEQRAARQAIRARKLQALNSGIEDDALLATEPKRKRKGLILANAALESDAAVSRDFENRVHGAPRIADPEYVLRVQDIDNGYINHNRHSGWFIHRTGSKGGIARTSVLFDKYLNNGCMHWSEYFIRWVADEMMTNENIKYYLKFNWHKLLSVETTNRSRGWAKEIFDNVYLQKHFNIFVDLTSDEVKFINAWSYIKGRYSQHDHVVLVESKLKLIELDPKNHELLELILKSTGLQYLDTRILYELPTKSLARDIFFNALNN